MRRDVRTGIFCLGVLLVLPINSGAQDLSYDGNRWFEVEISIFTNEYPKSEYSEIPVAEKLSLQYFPKLQKLLTPISSLMIDFPEPVIPDLLPQSEFLDAEPPLEEHPVEIGPLYSPAVRDGFKVNDYSRDAFIALVDRRATFTSINRNLAASLEHRILWHQVWRQPLQPRAQTPAIFVTGGEYTANHAELEGSLRLSDISGNTTLDINLWLNRFGNSAVQGNPTDVGNAANFGNVADNIEPVWRVPDLPLPLTEESAANVEEVSAVILEDQRTITEVWQLQQTDQMGANQLYYFDHPAFGVLIQLRPYLLPEQAIVTEEEDF